MVAQAPAQLKCAPSLLPFEYVIRNNWRGVLTFTREEEKFSVYIHRGSVAFVDSPYHPDTGLGRILIGQRKLSENQLNEALAQSKQRKMPLGRTLIWAGRISKTDLALALREQVRKKLSTVFAWESGQFEWRSWREPPGDADLVLTKGLNIMSHHLRIHLAACDAQTLETAFGEKLGGRLVPHKDLDRMAKLLQLSTKESRFLMLQVDGQRTVVDVIVGSPFGRITGLKLVCVALALGAITFHDPDLLQVGDKTSRIFSVLDHIQREAEAHLKTLDGLSFFEVLGVHWSSHPDKFEKAYRKQISRCDPHSPPLNEGTDALKQTAEAIQRKIIESYEVLDNRARRIKYRQSLFDATERKYAADMLVKQGEIALIRNQYTDAIEALEVASELDSANKTSRLLAAARAQSRPNAS